MIRRRTQRNRFYRDFGMPAVARQQVLTRASSGGLVLGLLYAAVVLHVAFPKSGVKWRGIPITIPDLVFALLVIVSFFRLWRPFHTGRRAKICGGLLLVSIAFFGSRILVERFYGYRLPVETDLANLTALCAYPLIFFVLMIDVDRDPVQRWIHKLIRWSLVFIILYGIAQKIFGDYSVVIPGLTANWTDAHVPDFLADKSNILWNGSLKLSSTYQNGGLFSTSLLLFFPLGMTLIRGKKARGILLILGLLAMAFTASRSAWVGTIFLVLLALQLILKRWIEKVALAAVMIVVVVCFVLFVPVVRFRVINASQGGNLSDWSGRLEPAAVLWHDSLANPTHDVQAFLLGPYGITRKVIALEGGGAYEMFYLAVYQIGGAVGLLIWLAPLAYSLRHFYRRRTDPVLRAIFLGLAAWMCAAISEGAFWLPPTAFNLWMLVGLGWLRLQSVTPVPKNVEQRAAKREVRRSSFARVGAR